MCCNDWTPEECYRFCLSRQVPLPQLRLELPRKYCSHFPTNTFISLTKIFLTFANKYVYKIMLDLKPSVSVGEAFAWVPFNPDISDKFFSVPSYLANTITLGQIGLKILVAPCINRSTNQRSLFNFNFNQIYDRIF